MNKVFLIGNLTHDPELTETAAGIAVCRFSIAVNRRTSDGECKADFYKVTAWRGLGETVARYARKGNKLAVVGNIELRTYEDRDGIERMSVDIIAQDVEFLTPKPQEDSRPSNEPTETNRARRPQLDEFYDGDIPF